MQLLYVRDPEQIVGYSDTVWDICQRAYRPIGGFKSLSRKEDIGKRVQLLKLVHTADADGNPVIGACALYLDTNEGFKGIGYAGNKGITSDYKECLELIIQDDIAEFTGWYWVEASGAVDSYFMKNHGILIPNIYVSRLLHREMSQEDLLPDGFWYKVRLGLSDPEVYTKRLYGFPNKEAYDSIISTYSTLDNFTKLTQDVLQGKIKASDLPKLESEEPVPVDKLKGALWYIFNLDECCVANDLYEVPPLWIALLKESMDLLYKYHDRYHSTSINNMMRIGEDLTKRLTPLAFHPFETHPVPHIDL